MRSQCSEELHDNGGHEGCGGGQGLCLGNQDVLSVFHLIQLGRHKGQRPQEMEQNKLFSHT